MQPLFLDVSCGYNPPANLRRRLALANACKIFKRYGRYVYMDIDPIYKGP